MKRRSQTQQTLQPQQALQRRVSWISNTPNRNLIGIIWAHTEGDASCPGLQERGLISICICPHNLLFLVKLENLEMPPKGDKEKRKPKSRDAMRESTQRLNEAVDNDRAEEALRMHHPGNNLTIEESVNKTGRAKSVAKKQKKDDGPLPYQKMRRPRQQHDDDVQQEVFDSESEDEANAIVPAKKQKTGENPYFVRYTPPHLFYVLEDTIFHCLGRERTRL